MVNGSRVVVTGTGAITSLGHTTRETWEAVKAGRSGVRRGVRRGGCHRIDWIETLECRVACTSEHTNSDYCKTDNRKRAQQLDAR